MKSKLDLITADKDKLRNEVIELRELKISKINDINSLNITISNHESEIKLQNIKILDLKSEIEELTNKNTSNAAVNQETRSNQNKL